MKTDIEKYKDLCRQWESDYHEWLDTHFLDGGMVGLRAYMEAVKPPLVMLMALEIQSLREQATLKTREALLAEALHEVLCVDGVLNEESIPTGPELLLAAEEYVAHERGTETGKR